MKFYDEGIENHVIIDGMIPSSYRDIYIGNGQNGICYLTTDFKVFKEISVEEKYWKDLITLSKIKSDFFVFPETLVYQKERSANNLKGYLMEYVDGCDFRNISENESIKQLACYAESVERELYQLTKEEAIILFDDLHYGNVLYRNDNKGLKIIDTDFYTFKLNEDFIVLFKENIRIWSEFLLYTLVGDNSFNSEKISNYFEMAVKNGKCRPSIILNYIEDIVNLLFIENY